MSIVRALGYPNRVVALLAPLLSPVVGAFATWLAAKWPDVPRDSLNEIFMTVTIIAIVPALQFIHGRLKWDLQQDQNQMMGANRSRIAAALPEEFAALGIEAPASDVPAPDTEAVGDTDLDLGEAGLGDDGFADDEEDAADDVVGEDDFEDDDFADEDDDFADEDEDLDAVPQQPTIAGG